MQLKLNSLLVSLLSCSFFVQVTAFPILPPNALTPPHLYNDAAHTVPIHFRSPLLELGLNRVRSSTDPEKHEADEQKDKASAEAKEKKEQENLKKAKAAEAAGNQAQADKERKKAAEEAGREDTANKHAAAAEAKEQAAKKEQTKKEQTKKKTS